MGCLYPVMFVCPHCKKMVNNVRIDLPSMYYSFASVFRRNVKCESCGKLVWIRMDVAVEKEGKEIEIEARVKKEKDEKEDEVQKGR